MESITIPSSVQAIDYLAFKDCNSLESVVICDGVKDINGAAFYGCSSLKSVAIPTSITKIIGAHLWYYSKSYGSWDEIASESWGTFENCESLDVYYAGNEAQWADVSGNNILISATIHFENAIPDEDTEWSGGNDTIAFDKSLYSLKVDESLTICARLPDGTAWSNDNVSVACSNTDVLGHLWPRIFAKWQKVPNPSKS